MEIHSATEHLCRLSIGEFPHNEVLVSVPLLLVFLLHQEEEEQNNGGGGQACLKPVRCKLRWNLHVHVCKSLPRYMYGVAYQCTLFHRVKWQVVFYMNKLKYVRWLASLVFFCSFWFMDSNFLHLLFNWDKTSLCKKPAMKKLWFTNYSSQHKCRSHAGTEWRIPVKKHKQNHANGYEQKNMPNDHKVTWEEGQIEHCTKTAR
jgi:hypothetical protein